MRVVEGKNYKKSDLFQNNGMKALAILAGTYFLTAVVLLLFAYVLYKYKLDDKYVNAAIVVIYVLMTFFAGFVAGKVFKIKKFIWGLILGCAYFMILFCVSAIGGMSDVVLGSKMISTFILCVGGGMLGGMLG